MSNDTIQRPAAAQVAALLREAREAAQLTQSQLARQAGVTRATVSAYESGRRAPSLTAADRMLAALGLQLRLGTEMLGSDLDAAIDELRTLPLAARLGRAGMLLELTSWLAAVPLVIEGAFAALAQGAPVPVEELHVAVAEADLGLLDTALRRMYADRWSVRWRTFGYTEIDPRVPGEPRWQTRFGRVSLRVVGALPESIQVQVGERRLAVAPLARIEAADPDMRRVLARVRQRLVSAA